MGFYPEIERKDNDLKQGYWYYEKFSNEFCI